MHTVTVRPTFARNGSPEVCRFCKGIRVIVREKRGASISPLLPSELLVNNLGRSSVLPASGQNESVTFLHKASCPVRVKAFL